MKLVIVAVISVLTVISHGKPTDAHLNTYDTEQGNVRCHFLDRKNIQSCKITIRRSSDGILERIKIVYTDREIIFSYDNNDKLLVSTNGKLQPSESTWDPNLQGFLCFPDILCIDTSQNVRQLSFPLH